MLFNATFNNISAISWRLVYRENMINVLGCPLQNKNGKMIKKTFGLICKLLVVLLFNAAYSVGAR